MTAGRYYRITPRFWQDPDVRNEWTEDMRLLAIYLMTSPHRNMVGLYCCPLSYMANDLQWSLKRVNISIDALQVSDFVRYDSLAQVVFLVNGLKHDAPTTPKQIAGALKVLGNLPKTALLDELREAAEKQCKSLANAMRIEWQSNANRMALPMSIECESNAIRIPDPVPRTPYPGHRTPQPDPVPTDLRAAVVSAYWQDNGFGVVGPLLLSDVDTYCDDHGMETGLILYAIELAAGGTPEQRKWSYVRGILERFRKSGWKRRAEAEAHDRRRKDGGGTTPDRPTGPPAQQTEALNLLGGDKR